jgi:hypothetical protein
MFKNRFANQLGTESEFSRDKNHGLYSLASRLDVPFKNVYPDSLRQDIFRNCILSRRVKCSSSTKLMCKCTYLTHNLFGLKNKKTDREAFACFHCVKDLVDFYTRGEIHKYIMLRRYRKWDRSYTPVDDIYEYTKDKPKYMIESAHYFRVITDDDRAILLDNNCDTKQKRALKKTVELFFIVGNGYNDNDLGRSLIINDEKNDNIDNQALNNVEC